MPVFLGAAIRHAFLSELKFLRVVFSAVVDFFVILFLEMKISAARLILILCILGICPARASEKTAADSLLAELDKVVASRGLYLAEKEKKLSELRGGLSSAKNLRTEFDALQRLFDEFHPYNSDSAYAYSVRQEAVAAKMGEAEAIARARMNRANVLCATGMYHEALELLDSIGMTGVAENLRPYYFHTKRTVYGRMADYSAFEPEKRKYAALTGMYRDSLMAVNSRESLAYVITKADKLNVGGAPQEAIDVLASYMSGRELSEHEKAICAWTLSESYAKLGNVGMQKEQLILSAIADMKSAVREYVSLRQLALLLYEDGDLDRAYKYMGIAVDDATKCDARQRIVELNDSYPMLNGIYVETVESQKEKLVWAIVVIALLSVALAVLLVCMRRQMRGMADTRREIEEAYLRLNELTDRLQMSNRMLSEANSDIAEISELKEVYIGKYMDLCLGYIDKLDAYRKSVGKLLNVDKLDELRKEVRSTALIDEELKSFYDQFDKTFLSLFPSFVEDFNRLLQPEEAIVPKKEGALNAELRIFALIRLGISDSGKIAKFLRYSLTTIYNYRTKVRNKARGDRNSLEEEVLKIGRAVRAGQGGLKIPAKK